MAHDHRQLGQLLVDVGEVAVRARADLQRLLERAVEIGGLRLAAARVRELLECAHDARDPRRAVLRGLARTWDFTAQVVEVDGVDLLGGRRDQRRVARAGHGGAQVVDQREHVARSFAEEMNVVADVLDRRIDLVGDASGQLAHGLEAMREPELGLHTIGAFERTLRTPSRWDEYLDGNRNALTANELDGLKVFSDIGCIQCHTGELIGGSMFQKVGAQEPWPNQTDQGRFEITHQEADRMVFKVPSLRNVALTAPYFHDGSVGKLPDAVRMMSKHQLGIELTDAETASIVAWLGSLTGTQPTIVKPTLPESGPTTSSLVSVR